MEADNGSPAVPDHVRETLCENPDIEFVVVFGSRAKGTERSSSDLDIAVKFDQDLTSEDRFRKRCRLSAQLQENDSPFVDLSDIDELPLEFAHAAVNGELICGDWEAFREFKTEVEDRFENSREEIERRQLDLIHRIAEEGLRG
ncbi:type VII toxin-antitoxin system MntA family adenylyltransferase antitoxin [Halobacteriaceae archaeon SHR40]|uniref:type VII toxin-antitoxin system MntA family adenylyltransferase antitoxin n=1 Tax=Halovenus amylolytica TaxID=2500550 RepID=UPI000FE2C9F6